MQSLDAAPSLPGRRAQAAAGSRLPRNTPPRRVPRHRLFPAACPPQAAARGGTDYAQLSRQIRQAGLLTPALVLHREDSVPSCCSPPAGQPSSCSETHGGSWPSPRSWPSCSPRSGSSATTPGTGRSSGPGRPTTSSASCSATWHRAELRLVGRASTTATTPTPTGWRGPGHRHRRAGLHRARRPAGPGAGPADLPLPGLPVLPDAAAGGGQPARGQHPGADQAPAPGTGRETGLLAVARRGLPRGGIPGPLAGQGGRVHPGPAGPVRPVPGLFLRPQPQGHADPGRRRPHRLPAPAGAHLAQRPRRHGHRLRPRRPQLPDRAPPVPVHAPAQPAARPGRDPGLLPAAADLPTARPACMGSYAQALRHLDQVGRLAHRVPSSLGAVG